MDIKEHSILKSYQTSGSFYYDGADSVKERCKDDLKEIPGDCSGVYMYAHKTKDGVEEILYIGASKNRLRKRVVGKHCRKTSKEFFSKEHLERNNIDKLIITWWNMGDKDAELVETILLFSYAFEHKKLPHWNSEIKFSENPELYEELHKHFVSSPADSFI